jgi:hypothetical protein
MNQLLQSLEQQLNNSFYEFNSAAKDLSRVNSLEIAENYGHVLIKAEYGCGKTYSLKAIADKALYLAHRTVLVEQNNYFAKAITINTLHTIRNVNEYEYLIIDEVLGVFAGLAWDEVPFALVCDQLQSFRGKIIALDRDASPRIAELLCELTGKQIAYYHHETDKRDKDVLFTRSLDYLINLAQQQAELGIKLILCDSKKRAEQLYNLKLDEKKYLITSSNRNEAFTILNSAEEDSSCWVFASPVIQEGLSLDSDKYVFSGYVHSGTKDILTPVLRGMQALHRVRNRKAIRGVCLLAMNQENVIEEADFEMLVKEKYIKACELLPDFVRWSFSAREKDFFSGFKEIGFKIYSHLSHLTTIQNAYLEETWLEELEKSGYTPIYVDKLNESIKLEYEALKNQGFPPFKTKYTKEHREELLKSVDEVFMEEHSIDRKCWLEVNRVSALRYFGVEKANDAEFVANYWEKGHYFRISKVYRLLFNQELGVRGRLFSDLDNVRDKLVRELLITAFGAEWLFLGTPRLKATFEINKADLYSSTTFKQLEDFEDKSGTTDERWLWKLLKNRYGLNCKQCGKQKSKYRIYNDIDFNNNRSDVHRLIEEYNLKELTRAYVKDNAPLNFAY